MQSTPMRMLSLVGHAKLITSHVTVHVLLVMLALSAVNGLEQENSNQQPQAVYRIPSTSRGFGADWILSPMHLPAVDEAQRPSSHGLLRRGFVCDEGSFLCPGTATCCKTGSTCCKNLSCARPGEVCCEDHGVCPENSFCCGKFSCAPNGGTCCEGGFSCYAGENCAKLGTGSGCCEESLCSHYTLTGTIPGVAGSTVAGGTATRGVSSAGAASDTSSSGPTSTSSDVTASSVRPTFLSDSASDTLSSASTTPSTPTALTTPPKSTAPTSSTTSTSTSSAVQEGKHLSRVLIFSVAAALCMLV